MQKYNIGELEFKNPKYCEKYIRNIINTLGCCIINEDHKQFNFFNNLIQRHPVFKDKQGVGISYFYIEPHSLMSKYYQLMIKRIDGSETDFSWIYCC